MTLVDVRRRRYERLMARIQRPTGAQPTQAKPEPPSARFLAHIAKTKAKTFGPVPTHRWIEEQSKVAPRGFTSLPLDTVAPPPIEPEHGWHESPADAIAAMLKAKGMPVIDTATLDAKRREP